MDLFESRVERLWPLDRWRGLTVVAALSGGADSVALVRCLAELSQRNGATVIGAHLNHGIRGALADEDEQFVRDLCAKLQLRFHVERVAPDAWPATGDGFESAARQARHAFLKKIARQSGARHIATAHTMNDQAETVLHRILRGTGLRGLAGIDRVRALDHGLSLVRPLLEISRAEILGYLQRLGQPWRQDATNYDLRYTRNRLRHELLPELRGKYNPAVDAALVRLARLAREAHETIFSLALDLAERCVLASDATQLTLNHMLLVGEQPAVVREMLAILWRWHGWPEQAMDATKWDSLVACVREGANMRRFTLPGGIDVERDGERVMLRRGDAGLKSQPRSGDSP